MRLIPANAVLLDCVVRIKETIPCRGTLERINGKESAWMMQNDLETAIAKELQNAKTLTQDDVEFMDNLFTSKVS